MFGNSSSTNNRAGRSFHARDLDEDGDSDDDSPHTEDDSLSQEDEDDEKKSDHSSGEDYSDDEDEGEEGYRPGGYHRVSIGQVYNQRCVVEKQNPMEGFSLASLFLKKKRTYFVTA